MKLLVISFYFRPDLCAGSFRATALVEALKAIIPAGSQIEVLTTLPNRYSSFSVEAPLTEAEVNMSIHRFAISAHKSGMIDQALAFGSFSRQVLQHVKAHDYDLVFATSSRLMTATLGAWVARRKKARLYLDIRDIFVDTIKDVLSGWLAWIARPVFSLVERWTINRAVKVNLVSEGFTTYFTTRYPKQKFTFFTNGIDDEFLAFAPSHSAASETSFPIKVLYAGNIGEGQGLHLIIPELANRMKGRVQFKVIGDGGRKGALRKALMAKGVDNVELLAPVSRSQLIAEYQDADVLFLHLNDYDAFEKVLPSKLFEYAALGKPIWAGIRGYSADFLKSEISNAVLFHPCNPEAAETVFSNLVMQNARRNDFIEKYARNNISRIMAQDILAVGNNRA